LYFVLRSLFFVTLVWVIKVTFATKANKVHRSRISDFRSQISDLRSQISESGLRTVSFNWSCDV